MPCAAEHRGDDNTNDRLIPKLAIPDQGMTRKDATYRKPQNFPLLDYLLEEEERILPESPACLKYLWLVGINQSLLQRAALNKDLYLSVKLI